MNTSHPLDMDLMGVSTRIRCMAHELMLLSECLECAARRGSVEEMLSSAESYLKTSWLATREEISQIASLLQAGE
jgi:hypothetical protein